MLDSRFVAHPFHFGKTNAVAPFTPEAKVQLLADCGRHCCLCLRWCGRRMQIHHIVPDSEGGGGDYDNGIPVCLDCHAEIESRSTMGRSFSAAELKLHRDRWFATVRERPEVLIRGALTQTETGPLEALLAEIHFNKLAVEGPENEAFSPPKESQFDRAIATNALATLAATPREAVQRAYALIRLMNYEFETLKTIDRTGGKGSAYASVLGELKTHRAQLVNVLPGVIEHLARALGRAE